MSSLTTRHAHAPGSRGAVLVVDDEPTIAEVDRVIGPRSGADDYMVKPFSPVELVPHVDAVMCRAEPAAVLDPPGVPDPPVTPRDAIGGDADARQPGMHALVAEISHDLRTPLTSVRLMVGALRDGLVEPERRGEYLARIEEQVSLLTELVDDLHSLAREQARSRRTRIEWIRPLELIEPAVGTMQIQARAAGVVLEIDVPRCLPSLRASPSELRRTLLNLIENAIRHARPGGKVVVRAERTLSGVEIEVEDDGEGIAVGDRDRVFDAFYGADRRAALARSGLGLSIARTTVEAHGGRIWVADSRCGTRVRFLLPACLERRPARRNGHARAAS